jgi:hypothetical protein
MGVTRINTSHGVKYRARVTINKQRISLGQFDRRYKAEEAIESHYRKNGIEYEPTGTKEQQFEDQMDKHLDNVNLQDPGFYNYEPFHIGAPRKSLWERVKGWFSK